MIQPVSVAASDSDPGKASSIKLIGINKSFSEDAVLKSINLDVQPGEFLTLVGPSGCGKSTLLRVIAGLESPDSGDLIIDGQRANDTPPVQRDLAMVFQSYALYPHLTVAENMMVPLKLRQLSVWQRFPIFGPLIFRRAYRRLLKQVQETADRLGLAELLARKPGELSGGQRQRVAVGRAMVRDPRAFLMDEPLSNLDAALRVQLRSELAMLHRNLKATFVYVTHDQAEALTLSDRVAVMMAGDILQLDSPETIYANPVNLTVARFIGSPTINTLPATVADNGQVICCGVVTELCRNSKLVDAPGQALIIGYRPEHLTLTNNVKNGWQGTVVSGENLGSDVFLQVAFYANDDSPALTNLDTTRASSESPSMTVIVRVGPHLVPRTLIGQSVTVAPKPGTGLLFNEAGDRLDVADQQETSTRTEHPVPGEALA